MPPRPPGRFTQSVVDGDIIETVVHGRVDDAIVTDSGRRALELMKAKPARYYYVIDARDASTYDASAVKAGREIAQVLFKAGVCEIIAITDSGMMRMMGATIAFALSDPISFVSTREEALAHVRTRRR
jgi:hypothetical protein